MISLKDGQLSDFDKQQIIEFLAFQREASKFYLTREDKANCDNKENNVRSKETNGK